MHGVKYAALIVALLVSSVSHATGTDTDDCTTTGACTSGAVRKLYVATTGNDTTGNGSASRPWLTLGKANSYVAANHLGRGGRVTVNVAAGNYPLTSTVTIAPAGGGSSGGSVTYKCTGAAGSCVVLGGTAVTGWAAHAGSISKKVVPACPYTLWENGNRARAAREPDLVYSVFYPTAFAPYWLTVDPGVSSHTVLQYNPVDWDPTGMALADLRLFHFTEGFRAWYTDTMAATAVNTGTKQFTLRDNGTRLHTFLTSGSRYHAQGNLAFLDQAGEFFCDSATLTLYYWPNATPIASQEIIRPVVQQAIAIQGTSVTSRTKNVTLDGFMVRYTDFADWFRSGYTCDPVVVGGGGTCSGAAHTYQIYDRWRQMPEFRKGAVYLGNADHVTLRNMRVRDTGMTGIFVDRYAAQHVIRDSLVEHTGAFGIHFDGEYPGEGDYHNHSRIDSVIVHGFGELAGHANGIAITGSGSNVVSHVEVHSGPRDCIYMSAFTDLAAADVYTHDNLIEYARVHDCDHDGGDVGGIGYAFFSSTAAPYIVNTANQITVDGTYATPSMIDLPPNGIFTDEQTKGQVFSNTALSNTQGALERENASGSHVLTNVNWTGVFNVNLMDFANIGARAGNPYLTAAKYTGADDFEGTFPGAAGTLMGKPPTALAWTAGIGTPTLSTTQAHSATHSFIVNEDGDLIYVVLPRRLYQTATVWFFDDAADTSMGVYARVDEIEYVAGNFVTWNSATWRGIGVDTSQSTTKYVYTDGASSFTTSVTRTSAWHEFTFDYTSGSGVTFKIDGTTVGTLTGVRQFDKISMGDPNTNGVSGTVYFDDVSVN